MTVTCKAYTIKDYRVVHCELFDGHERNHFGKYRVYPDGPDGVVIVMELNWV